MLVRTRPLITRPHHLRQRRRITTVLSLFSSFITVYPAIHAHYTKLIRYRKVAPTTVTSETAQRIVNVSDTLWRRLPPTSVAAPAVGHWLPKQAYAANFSSWTQLYPHSFTLFIPLRYSSKKFFIMAIEKFTIRVGGESFVFTRAQLESDPGNYFAEYFLIGFKDVPYGTRELEIEKEPLLFKLIQAHLRGYDILPLPDQWIPPYMTKEGALKNLYKEAQFYGLWNLQNRIDEFRASEARLSRMSSRSTASQKRYKLAQYKQSGWVNCDLSESGYKVLLQRFLSTPHFQLLAPTSLHCPGFTLVACWKDVQNDEDSNLGLPRLCICALLESDA